MELLVASIIAGIIAVVMGSVLLVGFKTTFAAGEVLNESANAQQLSQFLVPDVQSAGSSGIDISASPRAASESLLQTIFMSAYQAKSCTIER